MKFFILCISFLSSLSAVNFPLITDGYQLLLSNYDLVQNGDKFNCDLLPHSPTINNPVINSIPSNTDCIVDSNGNTDCTDTASTLSSVYSVLVVPAYSTHSLIDDSATRNFDFHTSFIGYQSTSNSDPLNRDQCVSYVSTVSIIAQQPVVAPSCDTVSTHLVGMDIYSNGNANTGRCVCNSNHIPSPNPTSCTAHTFNFEQNNTYTTVGDIFQNDTQNYAQTYAMTSLTGTTLNVEYVYDIYHTYRADVNSCNAVDLTSLGISTDINCTATSGCANANPPLDRYSTMLNEKISNNYYYMGNCYTLVRRKTTKGYQGLEVYSINTSGTGTNTGTGSNTGTGTTGSTTGTGTNTGSGTGTTTDTNTTSGTGTNTGTNTNTSTGSGTNTTNNNDVLHNDLLQIDISISSLNQTNSDGFSNLQDVGNGIIQANNHTTDVLKDLRDMNKNDVNVDTSFLNNFNSFATDMQTSISNVENTVNDVMATINGDFTPNFQTPGTCEISYSIYGSQSSINLCQYASIIRPYFVFILTIFMLILLIRLHLYLFPLVYRSSN